MDNRPPTMNLDPASYDAFMRDGPNRHAEWVAVRRKDLDRILALLQEAQISSKSLRAEVIGLEEKLVFLTGYPVKQRPVLDTHTPASDEEE